mgnify:CR=1 FL=1
MTLEQIQKALAQGGRISARYRDQWGFITSGVILATEGGDVLIDTLKNRVNPDQVLSIKYL